ncbi:unnamed protein product [Allacma fusca]|uniref:PX domain-containing protein n=1 Tax=Allacma fusca TaxID=39272 RepID=A0A8J2LFS6_9HEXA|nr:unnamed protein product [Allacma fusca]
MAPLEVRDKKMKRYIKVELVEPITVTTKEHFAWSTSFTSYLVRIETNHWAFSLPASEVRRRYSEFCWLRAKLKNHHPNKLVPPLPPRRFVHVTKFDPKVIEERRVGLGKFLQRVMRSDVLLSDAALHLFLQSDLSTEDIDKKLAQEMKPGLRKCASLPHYLLRSHSNCSTTSDTEHEPEPEQNSFSSDRANDDKATLTMDDSQVSTNSTNSTLSSGSTSEVDPFEFDFP